MGVDVLRWLGTQEAKSTDPAMAVEYSKLDELYSKKLWHQVTVKLLELFPHPSLQQDRALVEFYENFLKDVEMKINPLSLMELCVRVVGQMKTEEALEFLEKTEPKLKASKEAQALCRLTKGEIILCKQNDIPAAKAILESVDELLLSIDGITSVHGRFYLLESELHQQLRDTAGYYKSALKFLGCTDLNTLSSESQQKHAEQLAIAALVGEGIYNFGELLAHPVLNSLKRTGKQWLVDLMRAFNEGNIKKFRALRKQWSLVPELKDNEEDLTTKITLLCIMEMTFKRSSFERQLTFQEIMQETELSEGDVELAVMKAVSKGLVKGQIDQVGQRVYMTWVQPRVLNLPQISSIISRLDDWKLEISGVEKLVADTAADILL